MKKLVILVICFASTFELFSQEPLLNLKENKSTDVPRNLSAQNKRQEETLRYPNGVELKIIPVDNSTTTMKFDIFSKVPDKIFSNDGILICDLMSSGPPFPNLSNSYPMLAIVMLYFESIGNSGYFNPSIIVESSHSSAEPVAYTEKLKVIQNKRYALEVTYFLKDTSLWTSSRTNFFTVKWISPTDSTQKPITSYTVNLPASGVGSVNAKISEITSDMTIKPIGVDEESITKKDKVKWIFNTGSWTNSLILSNSILYVGSRDNNLYAVDPMTGKEIWRFKSNEPVVTPYIADKVIYFSGKEKLYAIESDSGKEKWTITINKWMKQPAVQKSIICLGCETDSLLYAFDVKNGKEIWNVNCESGFFYGRPVFDSSDLYVSCAKTLFVLDTETGKEKWRFTTGDNLYMPLIHENVIFVGCRDSYLYAIDKTEHKILWKTEISGEMRRDFAPVVSDGIIIFACGDNSLFAVDEKNGDKLWEFMLDGFFRPPLVKDGTIYVSNINRNFYAIDKESGKPLWKYEPPLAGSMDYKGLPASDEENVYIAGKNIYALPLK